jgi:uncharacterized protein (TIGR03083 family)
MEKSRFLKCLSSDYRRVREVVPGHLGDRVPTCPEWTVKDLTQHLGTVYLHKARTLRDGAQPKDWPPRGIEDEDPVALLDRGYAELIQEFATREPGEVSDTWYGPDQTVGFWIRRMAQESVIHRIDAELGAGAPVAPIPDDLAIDGVDELLKTFIAFAVREWPEDFAAFLPDTGGYSYAIATDGALWRVRTSPNAFDVTSGPGLTGADDGPADVTISGTPAALLRWAWNRETPGAASEVIVAGSGAALAEWHQIVVEATQ